MKSQRKYHELKIAILDIIELCEDSITREYDFLYSLPDNCFETAIANSNKNIARFERIKQYLENRYNN